MPGSDRPSFKLCWVVEDFSLWSGGKTSSFKWPKTLLLTLDALGGTEWQFQLCPCSEQDQLACCVQRASFSDVSDDISMKYIVCVLDKNGSLLQRTTGARKKISPGRMVVILLGKMEALQWGNLSGDRLSLSCELQLLGTSSSTNPKWKDELERLSDDMRKLLQSGYMSDLKLVSDDGRQIAVHAFVVFARWHSLRNALQGQRCTNRIAVRGVTGHVLAAFVFYLYTGTFRGVDISNELFEFAAVHAPVMRERFHQRPPEMAMRTRQRKNRLTFTWHADVQKEDEVFLFHVLPLHNVKGVELHVKLSSSVVIRDERYLNVSFSIARMTTSSLFHVRCTATFLVDDIRVLRRSSRHSFQLSRTWRFPDFVPTRLLVAGCRRWIEFELVISDHPMRTTTHRTVTEFSSLTRDVRNVELLASDLCDFFLRQPGDEFCDVRVWTQNGWFSSCRAVLAARSDVFRQLFEGWEKGSLIVTVWEVDSQAVAGVLQYLYTGWTKLSKDEDVLKIWYLARRLSLFGLMEKCGRYIAK